MDGDFKIIKQFEVLDRFDRKPDRVDLFTITANNCSIRDRNKAHFILLLQIFLDRDMIRARAPGWPGEHQDVYRPTLELSRR